MNSTLNSVTNVIHANCIQWRRKTKSIKTAAAIVQSRGVYPPQQPWRNPPLLLPPFPPPTPSPFTPSLSSLPSSPFPLMLARLCCVSDMGLTVRGANYWKKGSNRGFQDVEKIFHAGTVYKGLKMLKVLGGHKLQLEKPRCIKDSRKFFSHSHV